MRHMMNCSREKDYDKFVSDLEQSLVRRGYHRALLKRTPYDAGKRMELLRKLQARHRDKEVTAREDIIVWKTPFSPQLRQIRLSEAYNGLLQELRAHLGQTFLAGTRMAVAHPVERNVFLETYRMNYVKEDSVQPRLREGMRKRDCFFN